MKVITIGGVPAAGKTYTSKLLAKQYNFIALEFESLIIILKKIYINILNILLY